MIEHFGSEAFFYGLVFGKITTWAIIGTLFAPNIVRAIMRTSQGSRT